MAETANIKDLDKVVIRFSGDSGDGMQLSGNIFSNLSAAFGNEISTFPDFPAEIRAPQGSLSGVSGFQVHIGKSGVYTPGDLSDVLIAMNPAALKVNAKTIKPNAIIIIDENSFEKSDLDKALFTTDDPLKELGLTQVQLLSAPISQMVKDSLKDSGMDNKSILRCKNMFALGLVCWLFNRDLDEAIHLLENKFAKKPVVLKANLKVLVDGFNYGNNIHASVSTYRIESGSTQKGLYTDINGNKATAWGLIAAAERAGLDLFIGSYPITPASEIMQELAARKELGVKMIQAEDEIAGICTAIGASFAGDLAVTSTSGPGLALKAEAIGLAVIAELPLVIVNVQRGGPSTGMPTKTEQTDLNQALYGRNGESPVVVMAASTPGNCFDYAFWASKIAVEYMTPVILLTDTYLANGSTAWRVPSMEEFPTITPHLVTPSLAPWKPYHRDPESLVRYWAKPGTPGFAHRIGGLEKDYNTSAISTDAKNHQKMVSTRQQKIANIAAILPELEVLGAADADTLIVGWGSTYGHLYTAVESFNSNPDNSSKLAMAHFHFINPLPANTEKLLRSYKRILVCELNSGQFAGYLRTQFEQIELRQYNKVEGQPFTLLELEAKFTEFTSK